MVTGEAGNAEPITELLFGTRFCKSLAANSVYRLVITARRPYPETLTLRLNPVAVGHVLPVV